MSRRILVAASMFDGRRYWNEREHTVVIDGDHVSEVVDGDASSVFARPGDEVEHVAFLMPGLVEGHAHLFLNGGEYDTSARSDYLKSPFDNMIAVGMDNIQRSMDAGVTLLRDAGDRFGVNHFIRAETAGTEIPLPRVRSAGLGVRGPRGYGAFMAQEVADPSRISEIVAGLAIDSDDIKVILTGIIDFELGSVKGVPQFDLDGCRTIVASAHSAGRRTFAHCSGLEGLAIAVAAGIDSIEHGFFMNEEILLVMAEKQIAWVPTFSPVDFQRRSPQWCGWSSDTIDNLRRILDDHVRHVALAAQLGVPLVCGSDAGSHGVPHGSSLIDEIGFLLSAGLTMESALAAATEVPRRLWGEAPAGPVRGARAEMVVLNDSPFVDPTALRRVASVVSGGKVVRPDGTKAFQDSPSMRSIADRPGG
ncbi:MAG: amidohydrolase family protein [Acidimicrobiaceae bacterium]|nr:amidohydrolase family protein [Acidimicrobiaceae bacterium]